MKIERKYKKLCIEMNKEDIEDLALSMQETLDKKNKYLPLEICLDIVSKQVGFDDYKSLVEYFDNEDYLSHKTSLIHKWVNEFMKLGFNSWNVKEMYIEDFGTMLEFEILNDPMNIYVFDNYEDVYEKMWLVLSELLYLELNINPVSEISYNNKQELEKYILKETCPNDLLIKKILQNIHKHLENIEEINKICIINNCLFTYLKPEIENKVLYNNEKHRTIEIN